MAMHDRGANAGDEISLLDWQISHFLLFSFRRLFSSRSLSSYLVAQKKKVVRMKLFSFRWLERCSGHSLPGGFCADRANTRCMCILRCFANYSIDIEDCIREREHVDGSRILTIENSYSPVDHEALSHVPNWKTISTLQVSCGGLIALKEA